MNDTTLLSSAQIPWKVLGEWAAANKVSGFGEGSSGVGMVFIPHDDVKAAKSKALVVRSSAVYVHSRLHVLTMPVVVIRDLPVMVRPLCFYRKKSSSRRA